MNDHDKTHEQLISELNELRKLVSSENKAKALEIEHITNFITTVNSTIDIDQVVERLMTVLNDVFTFNQISIYLYNSQSQMLEVSHWYGDGVTKTLTDNFINCPISIDWDEVFFVKAFLNNSPKYIAPITPELVARYSERDQIFYKWNPHKSILILPLEVQGKAIGVINFVHTQASFELNDTEIHHIQCYVNQVAATINHAHLIQKMKLTLEKTQRKEQEIAHINDIIQTANTTLDFNKVFQAILDGLKGIFEFDGIAVQLADEEEGLLKVFKISGDLISKSDFRRIKDTPIHLNDKKCVSARVYSTGEWAYFPKVTDSSPFYDIDREIHNVLPFSAYLGLPLVFQGNVIGVITFIRMESHYQLSDADFEKIKRYVASISVTMANARNLDQLKYTNKIFSSLLEASALMHKEPEISDVIQYTLKSLSSLFPLCGFGLVFQGERPNSVEFAAFQGFEEDEKQRLFEHVSLRSDWSSEEDLSQWMTQNSVLDTLNGSGCDSDVHWFLFPMSEAQSPMTGSLTVKGPFLNQQSKDTISLFLKQASNVIANKRLTMELEKQANTDGLTNTYNRLYFDSALERVQRMSKELPFNYFSLFVIDLNGLKHINDDFGHVSGDNFIKSAADVLLSVCRKSDFVCRYGGDEFIVVAPNTNYELAGNLLDRIREAEREAHVVCRDFNGREETVPISMSIGVASSEDTAPKNVLEVADARMYEDKNAFYQKRREG